MKINPKYENAIAGLGLGAILFFMWALMSGCDSNWTFEFKFENEGDNNSTAQIERPIAPDEGKKVDNEGIST